MSGGGENGVQSGAAGKPKWPSPITFNDDDPQPGFAYVFLTVPELKTKKMFGLFGKATAKNAEITLNLTAETLVADIKVTESNATEVFYQYKKPLPENIDPQNSDHKVKNGQVILLLCKEKKQSWAQHAKYFLKKD